MAAPRSLDIWPVRRRRSVAVRPAAARSARQERPGGAARFPTVAFVFFMTLPGLVVGLVALAAVDLPGGG